jgi:tRNA threonylcarbamoyl adenosine modification protein (Sua5/YciO/YrdC/YwlC family)
MSQFFQIHPQSPQKRLISQSVRILKEQGLIVYPTDSGYALGWLMAHKSPLERVIKLRQLSNQHHFSLVCQDLSQVAQYAFFDNAVFKLLKQHTPNPYTFILKAKKDVPKRVQHPKKKSIGVRLPNHPICSALLDELDQPLMSTSLIMPGATHPLADALEIRDLLERQVDLIIDAGLLSAEPTTVVNLCQAPYEINRIGGGDPDPFL